MRTSTLSTSRLFLVLIILVFVANWLWLFSSSTMLETVHEDAIARLYQAWMWVEKGDLLRLPSQVWPPGHAFLLSLPLWFGLPPVISSQILTLFFGISSCLALFLWVRKLFHEELAVWSVFVFSFLPISTVFSTVTMSEVPTVFFVLSALFLLQRLKKGDLVLASVCLNMAMSLRFEIVPFAVGLMPLVLYIRTKNLKLALTFFAACITFPVFYTLISLRLGGSLNHYWTVISTAMVNIETPKFSYFGLLRGFIGYFGFLMIPIIMVSFIRARRDVFVLGVVLLLCYLTYSMFTSKILASPRYYFLWAVLLLPYGLHVFLRRPWIKVVFALCVVGSFYIILLNHMRYTQNNSIRSAGFSELLDWVKLHVPADQPIYFEGGTWSSANLGLGLERPDVRYTEFSPQMPRGFDHLKMLTQNLKSTIGDRSGLVIYNRKPIVQRYSFLYRPGTIQALEKDFSFREKAIVQNYIVYEIKLRR